MQLHASPYSLSLHIIFNVSLGIIIINELPSEAFPQDVESRSSHNLHLLPYCS